MKDKAPQKVSFWRLNKNVIRVDSGSIIYELEYFADHKNITIIDNFTGLVKSIKWFEKDHGNESAGVNAQDVIKSSMPGVIQNVYFKSGDSVKAG